MCKSKLSRGKKPELVLSFREKFSPAHHLPGYQLHVLFQLGGMRAMLGLLEIGAGPLDRGHSSDVFSLTPSASACDSLKICRG